MEPELFELGPRVDLIDYTGIGRRDQHWHAADMLIFTKSTRLNMNPNLFKEIQDKPVKWKMEELEKMAATIPSSWEFVDVTFLISDITRACAQQVTRTRTGSYAMQSQRVVDVSSAGVMNPALTYDHHLAYEAAAAQSIERYKQLIEEGMQLQDARGLLPINIKCNLVAKYNLRAIVDLVRARESLRTQGEYVQIVGQMKNLIIGAWKWSKPFFESPHDKAIKMLETVVKRMDMTTGGGDAWEIAKAIDLIRK
jgi:thymidylate synthase (FAD)